jgi:hypothetical protein
MEKIIENEKGFLAFTDWLDIILEDKYKTDKFFLAVWNMANVVDIFELAGTYTKSGSSYIYKAKV